MQKKRASKAAAWLFLNEPLAMLTAKNLTIVYFELIEKALASKKELDNKKKTNNTKKLLNVQNARKKTHNLQK